MRPDQKKKNRGKKNNTFSLKRGLLAPSYPNNAAAPRIRTGAIMVITVRLSGTVHDLHVCENLFNIHAVLIVLVGVVWLFESAIYSFLYDHIFRFTEGGRALCPFQIFCGVEMLRAANVEVLRVLLPVSLPVIKVIEIGHDDRYGQRNGQHASDGAQRSHDFASDGYWMHVSVADRSHGNHSPPESIRDAAETGSRVVGLGEVDGAGKQDDPDEEEEDEESQLPHAGFEGLAENLEAFGVARELEDAKDPHQTDHAEDGQRHGLLAVALALGQLRPQSDEVRNNSHDINDIHDVFGKSSLAGAREESHEQFKREPDDAKGLDHKERVCESAGHERASGIRNR